MLFDFNWGASRALGLSAPGKPLGEPQAVLCVQGTCRPALPVSEPASLPVKGMWYPPGTVCTLDEDIL